MLLLTLRRLRGTAAPDLVITCPETKDPTCPVATSGRMTSKYKNDERDGYPERDYPSVTYHSVGLMPIALNGVSLRRPRRSAPPPVPVEVQSASGAWSSLIEDGDVGANRRVTCRGEWVASQDPVDRRLLADARSGSGPDRDSFIRSQNEVGDTRQLIAVCPVQDSDGDGMPDEFETRYGLDPYSSLQMGSWTLMVTVTRMWRST